MKFQANKTDLYNALTAASKACSLKSTISVLENVLLQLEGNTFSVTGYDLETGITVKVDVQGTSDGACVANGNLLSNIIKKMEADKPIEVFTKDNNLFVKQGNTKLKVPTLSANDYPNLPYTEEAQTVSLPAETFKNVVSQTLYAAAKTDIKPVHKGCKFEVLNGVLNVYAVDGVRLARTKVNVDSENVSVVIPVKVLQEASKIASEPEENFTISIFQKFVSISKRGYVIISRILDGEFLDCDKVLNFVHSLEAVLNTDSFCKTIDKALAIIPDKFKSPVLLTFEDNQIKVSCITTLGEFEDTIECDYNGECFTIAFNGQYLLEAASRITTEAMKLQLVGALKPMRISEMEGDAYQAVVLPVRVKQ